MKEIKRFLKHYPFPKKTWENVWESEKERRWFFVSLAMAKQHISLYALVFYGLFSVSLIPRLTQLSLLVAPLSPAFLTFSPSPFSSHPLFPGPPPEPFLIARGMRRSFPPINGEHPFQSTSSLRFDFSCSPVLNNWRIIHGCTRYSKGIGPLNLIHVNTGECNRRVNCISVTHIDTGEWIPRGTAIQRVGSALDCTFQFGQKAPFPRFFCRGFGAMYIDRRTLSTPQLRDGQMRHIRHLRLHTDNGIQGHRKQCMGGLSISAMCIDSGTMNVKGTGNGGWTVTVDAVRMWLAWWTQ